MNHAFHSDAMRWLQQTERDSKAWLGALQYAVYARRQSSEVTYNLPIKAYVDSYEKPEPGPTHVPGEAWLEALTHEMQGALSCAQSALGARWMKRKDPRHDSPEAEDAFVHEFEQHAANIAKAVLKASSDIEEGAIIPTRNARDALDVVKNDLKEMIDLYTQHCYEMTCSERADSLLALRAQIVDGGTKSR